MLFSSKSSIHPVCVNACFHPGHRIRQYHTIQIITVIKCCIINSGHTFRERHTFCRASGKSKASDLRGSFWYTHCFDRLVTIIFPFRNFSVFCLRCDILRFTVSLLSCYRFRIALLQRIVSLYSSCTVNCLPKLSPYCLR